MAGRDSLTLVKSLPSYRYWTIFGAVILIAAASSLASGSSHYGVFGLVLGIGFVILGEVERARGGRIF